MTASFEVQELLEQAAAFARAHDPAGAASRARLALARASNEESRQAARFALDRLEAAERTWRKEITLRERAFAAREAREARVFEAPADAGRGETCGRSLTRATAREEAERDAHVVGDANEPQRGKLGKHPRRHGRRHDSSVLYRSDLGGAPA